MTDLERKILALATKVNGRPVGRTPLPAPGKAKRKVREVATGERPRWAVVLYPACRVVTEANTHEHWAAGSKRRKAQKAAVLAAWLASPLGGHWGSRWAWLPLVVTLTHSGPKMDDDNLARAFKAVRDELAGLIGVDDGDGRVEWKYEQHAGPNGIAVRIEESK